MKISATTRLKAVMLKPGAYTDAHGKADLNAIQSLFGRSRRKIGKDKNGIVFWWVGRGENTLVCSKGATVIGFIELRPGYERIDVGEDNLDVRAINVMYLSPEYRGRGLILGMHQYLITRFNLMSDDLYTPDGLKVWYQLKKIGHKIEVVTHSFSKSQSWLDPYNTLIVRRGQ